MQNYNFIQKLLHDLVLGNKFIKKSLYELEKSIYLKKNSTQNNKHIFISSLPRSGTTILLNLIFSSNEFASLKYSNMPYILSPNFSKIFPKKEIKKRERFHGDKIMFDLESPEAFDEVFFSTFNNEEIKNELVNYVNLILTSQDKTRYLSKNNLNFNRLDLIIKLLPSCNFLIPIREPLQHAYSLLNQHLHFSQLQKKDDFIRRYMNYLGHYEFGLNHKSWNNPINYQDFNKIDYWLEQWCLFYQNILNKCQSYTNCHFVVYEELTNPNYIKTLLEKINFEKIENIDVNYFKNSNKQEINIDFSKNVYKNASNVYNDFKDRFILN